MKDITITPSGATIKFENGSLIGTVTPVGYFTGFTGLVIGAEPNGVVPSSMRIKKIAYYPIAFTGSQNQALTGS